MAAHACEQTNTTGDDESLTVPIIEKLCKFLSIILAGTWCSPDKKWYSTFDTTGSVPLGNQYWLSVAQGWDGQLAVVKISGRT